MRGRLGTRELWLWEAGPAILLFAYAQLEIWVLRNRVPGPELLVVVLAAAMTLPLAFRNRAPLALAVYMAVVFVIQNETTRLDNLTFVLWMILLATYAFGAYLPLWKSVAALAIVLVPVFLPGGEGWEDFIWIGTINAAGWLSGRAVRAREHRLERERAGAAHAERESRERTEGEVAAERARIAGELGEVVGTGVEGMVARAGEARSDTVGGAASLDAIEATGRDVLARMRRLLGELGRTDAAPGDAVAVLATDGGAPSRGFSLREAAPALVVFAVSQFEIWVMFGPSEAPGPPGLIALVAAAMTLPLAVATRYPLLTAAITVGANQLSLIAWSVPERYAFPTAALIVAGFAVGAYCDLGRSLVGVAILGIPTLISTNEPQDVLVIAPFILTTWIGGRGVRVLSAKAEAESLRAAATERESEERARRAVAAERDRIARELHDVVGHGVSVIVMQSQLARGRDAGAAAALEAVERTGRETIAELELLLGLLRSSDEEAASRGFSRERLERMVAAVRDGGLPVALEVDGQPRAAPPGVELAAYRVVQEALTNALKHGAAGEARVRVRWAEDLELEITNPVGAPAAANGAGRGLVGMRERVAMVSGTVDAGCSNGGFVVSARLPLSPPA